MGVYVFNYPILEQMLREDHENKESSHDFGKDILPRMVQDKMSLYAYPYGGYWIDVGTLDAYWEAHMDLLETPPSLNLNDRTWVIHTRSEERPPVRIHAGAVIRNSLITDGSTICEGAVVERSVLSPGVYVGPNAVVRESIILNDAYIEAGAVVERCIIDKIAVIGHNARVGKIPEVGELGITCIGKNTHIPPGYSVGNSVVMGTDLKAEQFAKFEGKIVPSGTRLGHTGKK
jgi:glucose-1-phosphate adenylyltransferase